MHSGLGRARLALRLMQGRPGVTFKDGRFSYVAVVRLGLTRIPAVA